MNRRDLIFATGALLGAPLISRAQAQKRLPVLGLLSVGSKPTPNTPASPFEKRLSELGWIEGKTLLIERVYAEFKFDRLPELAAMLVAKKVDVIWTGSPLGTVAAARATSTIPIVFWGTAFPVELGLVDSLARPGRNVTGITFSDVDTILKRYQLLREMAPDVRRLAIFWPSNTLRGVSGDMINLQPLWDKLDAFLRALRFESRKIEVLKAADIEPACTVIAQWKADSLSVPDTPETISERKRIVDFARRNRLPTVFQTHAWVQAGGLFSYGLVVEPTVLRTADMVDRILRGAKPADLPVELPNLYELSLNLATARELGIKVPQSIRLRADRVIE